jgi:hypothetical protein
MIWSFIVPPMIRRYNRYRLKRMEGVGAVGRERLLRDC